MIVGNRGTLFCPNIAISFSCRAAVTCKWGNKVLDVSAQSVHFILHLKRSRWETWAGKWVSDTSHHRWGAHHDAEQQQAHGPLTAVSGRAGQLPRENELAESLNRVLFSQMKHAAEMRLFLTVWHAEIHTCFYVLSSWLLQSLIYSLNHQAVAQLQAVRMLKQSLFSKTKKKEPRSRLLVSLHPCFSLFYNNL